MANKSSEMLPSKIQYKTWENNYRKLANGDYLSEIQEKEPKYWYLNANKDNDNNWNVGYYLYGPDGPEDELPKSKKLENIDPENWREYESFIGCQSSGKIKHGITNYDFDKACDELLKWLYDNSLL